MELNLIDNLYSDIEEILGERLTTGKNVEM